MQRKNTESQKREQPETQAPVFYRVINLTESIMALPYYDETGQVNSLNLRIQGRGGQTPPVLPETAITGRIQNLVKKRMIRLEKVK